MQMIDRKLAQRTADKRYKDSVELLDGRYAFFLTHVLKMGEPKWTEILPTAGIALSDWQKVARLPEKEQEAYWKNADTSQFDFLFNPQFAAQMDTDTFTFVLSHECLHLLLNHLGLAKDFDDKQKFNIAADCVINDYLMSAGMAKPTFPDNEAKKKAREKGIPGVDGCFGQEVVGFNCTYATVAEVYDAITDETMEQMKGESECDGSCQPGDGSGGGKACTNPDHQGDGRGAGAFDDHGWMHGGTAEQAKQLEEMYEALKGQMPKEMDKKRDDINAQSSIGDMAGTGKGAEADFVKQFGCELAWVKLMKMVTPDVFRVKGIGPPMRPSFHTPRRKLAAFAPGGTLGHEIMLPVERKEKRKDDVTDEIPAIVMALDTSGSIGKRDADRFITLAQSIPKKRIRLYACTFTDGYEPLDLDNPKYSIGGTNFSAIEDFIQKHVVPDLGHYPKAVVVVTDGYADFFNTKPPKDKEANWLWVLTRAYGGGYTATETVGKKVMLDDYII